MAREVSRLRIFMVFLWTPVMCRITGPAELTYKIGETAEFKWNTSDRSSILSATWGIKKGNIPDPQFINVDILRNKAYLNSFLEPNLMMRLSFEGDLQRGRAWFTLKNVTVNDTNVYIASISDYVYRVLPYTVALTVKEKEKKNGNIEPKKTTDPSRFPEIARTTPTKEPTKRIGPSRFPEIPRTTLTKVTETEVYTKNGPKEDPVYSSGHEIIYIAVTGSVVVLSVFISAFLLYKRNFFEKIRRGTNSSEKELMEDKADI